MKGIKKTMWCAHTIRHCFTFIIDPRIRDSCYYNRDICDVNSDCVPQRDGTYRCVCREGYLSK
mgnify:CR=1 FL=1